LNHVTIFT